MMKLLINPSRPSTGPQPRPALRAGVIEGRAGTCLGLALATALQATPVAAAEPVVAATAQNQPATDLQSDVTWKTAPGRTVTAGGIDFAYRELGEHSHLAAVMDNWDPRANDKVDLLGFSLGDMVAQDFVLQEPQLVRKMVRAGTGRAGGEGISTVAWVTLYDMLRGVFTGQDAKQFLFFTRTPGGTEAGKERTENRDKEISASASLAQLEPLRVRGQKTPADLAVLQQPVLVVNGDDDRMVPRVNTRDMARRLPISELIIYPDAGHGGAFQFHAEFVTSTLGLPAR